MRDLQVDPGNTLEVYVSRNRPRDPSAAFEWPPSPGDLSSVSVMQVSPPTAPAARTAPVAPSSASPVVSSTARRSRRRINTLQQLTLLAAGMLVGAALPGIDDGRRPILGVAQAAEASVASTPSDDAAASVTMAVPTRDDTMTDAVDAAGTDATAASATGTAAAVTPDAPTARPATSPVQHRDPRTRQVLQTLRKYESAFSRMDASATSAVWPSADRDQLTRTFTAVREQRLWLRGCTVSGTGPQAAGTCRGTLRYRPRVGDHSTRLRHGTWRFALERADDTWLIRRVTVS